MKVAVSIPDDLFDEAEQLVRDLKVSRSTVYARALSTFVAAHDPDRLTQAMNDAVEEAGEGADSFASAAARRVLDRSEW